MKNLIFLVLIISCGQIDSDGAGTDTGTSDSTIADAVAETISDQTSGSESVSQVESQASEIAEDMWQESSDAMDEATEAYDLLNGLDYFGGQLDFRYAFYGNGSCEADDFVQVGYGGVYRQDASTYYFDGDNSYNENSTKYRTYYSPTAMCIQAAATAYDLNEFESWGIFDVVADYGDLSTGTQLTKRDSSGSINGYVDTTFTLDGKYLARGYQMINKGSGSYLQMTNTGSSLDSFMTNSGGDWSFGFTLKEDWNVGGGALQMFVDSSSTDLIGNFGVVLFDGYMGLEGYLSHSGGGTLGQEWISLYSAGALPQEGDSMAFFYDSNNNKLHIYLNDTEIADQSADFLPSSLESNRSMTWGKPKNTSQTAPGEGNYDFAMPVYWSLKIKDLWIANNDLIDANEIASISSAIETSDDLTTYSQYSTAITHHWPLTDNLDASKGDLNFTVEYDWDTP